MRGGLAGWGMSDCAIDDGLGLAVHTYAVVPAVHDRQAVFGAGVQPPKRPCRSHRCFGIANQVVEAVGIQVIFSGNSPRVVYTSTKNPSPVILDRQFVLALMVELGLYCSICASFVW